MNYYTCDNCYYTFETAELPDLCPDCGKPAVRCASTIEVDDYIRIRAEIEAEDAAQTNSIV